MRLSRIELNPYQIEQINWRNSQIAETGLENLLQIEPEIQPEALRMLLQVERLQQEPRYDGKGNVYPEQFYEELKQRISVEQITDIQPLRYAVAVSNARIRLYPTMAVSCRNAEQDTLDRYAISVLKVGEPVLIYWQDRSATWNFVRTVQGFGWVPCACLALEPDVSRWQQYCMDEERLVVVENRRSLDYVNVHGHTQRKQLRMGTRLPLYDATRDTFVAGLPIKDASGKLAILQILLPRDGGLVPGYVPLSGQNIISQAKKILGDPYGLGGTNFYRDCTMLITDVFSVFGLQFARNSVQQMQMVGMKCCPALPEQKAEFFRQLMPGSVLYCSGHAMVYLGRTDGEWKILHAVYAIGLPERKRMIPYKLCRVVEGHLLQQRVSGETFWDAVHTVWAPDQQKAILR